MVLNKKFEYVCFKFNIKVELNFHVERHFGGKCLHQITCNDMGIGNFYKRLLCETVDLEKTITDLENEAKKYVDLLIDGKKSEEEELLNKFGFK
jgi:hypothetical protein